MLVFSDVVNDFVFEDKARDKDVEPKNEDKDFESRTRPKNSKPKLVTFKCQYYSDILPSTEATLIGF